MATTAIRFSLSRIRCYYRPLILVWASLLILGVFWFASRYPQLIGKAQHVGDALPSMAYSSEILTIARDAPLASAMQRCDDIPHAKEVLMMRKGRQAFLRVRNQ